MGVIINFNQVSLQSQSIGTYFLVEDKSMINLSYLMPIPFQLYLDKVCHTLSACTQNFQPIFCTTLSLKCLPGAPGISSKQKVPHIPVWLGKCKSFPFSKQFLNFETPKIVHA